jgi:hypothetical protein
MSVKASFLLTGSELILLIDGFDNGLRTPAAQYMTDVFLNQTGDSDKAEVAQVGLIEKKLIRKASGMLFVEPVIKLIVKDIVTADRTAIVKPVGYGKPFYVMLCSHMVLMLASYELKEGSFKITPFPDMAALREELGENGIDLDEAELMWVPGDDELASIEI